MGARQSETLRSGSVTLRTDVKKIRNMLQTEVREQQAGEVLFLPDEAKAFLTYEICRTMPHVAGPASSGNYTTLFPAVVAKCHETLRNQQLNREHEIVAYDPEGIERDRIIGAIVHTVFDWDGNLPETAAEAPVIDATAVIWKQAEGVAQLIADYLSGEFQPAVSIEMTATYDNLGVFQPSTRKVFDLLDLPDEILYAISEDEDSGHLMLGKTAAGEQLAWAYGKEDGDVLFRGTGVVAYPADETAKIKEINAAKDADEGIDGNHASDAGKKHVPASGVIPVPGLANLCLKPGQEYVFQSTGRKAKVNAVYREGRHGPGDGLLYTASDAEPVYEFLLDGRKVYLPHARAVSQG